MEAVWRSRSSSSFLGWMIRVTWQLLLVANLRKAPMMWSWTANLESYYLASLAGLKWDRRAWTSARYVLVHGEVLLAHHELKVVDDHVVDVVHVDSMLHGVQHRPVGGVANEVTVSDVQYWTDIKYPQIFQILIFDIDKRY